MSVVPWEKSNLTLIFKKGSKGRNFFGPNFSAKTNPGFESLRQRVCCGTSGQFQQGFESKAKRAY